MELKGKVTGIRFVEGELQQIRNQSHASLLDTPAGQREREILYGEDVRVFEDVDGFAFVQTTKDGYVGYVASAALADPVEPTHFVSVPSTHLLCRREVQAPNRLSLPFGARIRIIGEAGRFLTTHDGLFIPRNHVRPTGDHFVDHVSIAEQFIHAPYLWGGNTVWGIDCSGLVQVALLGCGLPCPADSDMQMALGRSVGPPFQRGDLLFWKGHVSIVTNDREMIHANAHAMAVSYEPIEDAKERIVSQGDGPMIAHRRL